MARIETKRQKMVRKLREFILGRMSAQHIKQQYVAEKLFITQPTVCYKLKTMTFDVSELMTLFEILEVEPDEVSRLMLGRES